MKKQKNKETLNWVNRPIRKPETSEDRMGDMRSLPLERLTLTFAKRKKKGSGNGNEFCNLWAKCM